MCNAINSIYSHESVQNLKIFTICIHIYIYIFILYINIYIYNRIIVLKIWIWQIYIKNIHSVFLWHCLFSFPPTGTVSLSTSLSFFLLLNSHESFRKNVCKSGLAHTVEKKYNYFLSHIKSPDTLDITEGPSAHPEWAWPCWRMLTEGERMFVPWRNEWKKSGRSRFHVLS